MRQKDPNEKYKGIWHKFPEKIVRILTLFHTHDNRMGGFKFFCANGHEMTYGDFDTISDGKLDYYVVKELILDN